METAWTTLSDFGSISESITDNVVIIGVMPFTEVAIVAESSLTTPPPQQRQ